MLYTKLFFYGYVQNGLVTYCIGNCLQDRVTEGRVEGRTEVTGRRRTRRKQLLDVLKETRGTVN